MHVKYLLLNKSNNYKQKDTTFCTERSLSASDKNRLCEITRQPNRTIGMRVKHAIRQKDNILWCLT